MEQAKIESLKADIKKELKLIKETYKRIGTDNPPPADEILLAAHGSSHVTTLLNILYNDAVVRIIDNSSNQPTTGPVEEDSDKLQTEELIGALRYLKKEYHPKVIHVSVTPLELAEPANFADMAIAYDNNIVFDLPNDQLMLLTLAVPEKYSVHAASLRVLFYTNPAEWNNLNNTAFEITTHTGTSIACTAMEIPPSWKEVIYDSLMGGKIISNEPDGRPIKAEPKETDPLDMIVHVDNSFNDSMLRKITAHSIDCNRLIPYFVDIFGYSNLNAMREEIGNAKSVRHSHDGRDFMFATLTIDIDRAEHGYNTLHALYSTDSSLAHEAIFELVNDTNKSLVRISANNAITRRQFEALINLVNNGHPKTYPLSKLPVASDLPNLSGCAFERITNNEDLSEFVTRLPSGTLTIDPRVTDLLGDLTTPSLSVLNQLSKYLPNFIPVINGKHLGVPHGLYRHAALRDDERTHNGKIVNAYIRSDNAYADMVLRMRATTDLFECDDRNDDRDWTNVVTLTWHGTVSPNGRIHFPIDQSILGKLFFTFHTADIPQGTPVRVTEATYFELVELIDAICEQFREWEQIGSKPLIKPITVSTTDVYESSMPQGSLYPEQAAVEAIVDGVLGLKDMIKK